VTRSRLIFFVCFMAAFGAGICVGLLWQRPAPSSRADWLAELNLTPEQQEKIRAIWTDAMKASDWQTQREKREAAQKERDEALSALVTGERKPRYEEIMGTYRKKADAITQESRKARDEAYERTKALLTESQRVKYDELRKKRLEAHGRSRTDSSKAPAEGSAPGKSNAPAEGEPKKPEGTPEAR